MSKPNKYLYMYVVQGNYGSYGWEDLLTRKLAITSGSTASQVVQLHIESSSDVSPTRHTSASRWQLPVSSVTPRASSYNET